MATTFAWLIEIPEMPIE
uniref:Uncharacterized protein n=1 Tax=Bracon brevicornis TaxID=1563983 RepID=A0A6V7KBB7_9HYME